MTLNQKLTDALQEAMRAKDAARVSVIRLLRATIKNKEIEKGKGCQLTEEEVLQVIASSIKQRKESIDLFNKGKRADLAEKETKELAILQGYLPQPLTDEELKAKIAEAISQSGATGIKQMGQVMRALMPQIVGRADGNKVSEAVRLALGKR